MRQRSTRRSFCFRLFAGALLLIGATTTTTTSRAAELSKLDPEYERSTFKIADGWEINLFAAEPMIEKPIEMNWDPAGRLWCATSETYPQLKPGQIADDKIIILEDTKGVGRADKSTVFADHLLIPNSVAPGDGGAYVTNSTEVLHFRENKRTEKADARTVVLDGFGTEDTHHIIHTLRWGPDGRLYFNQSIYIHAHVSTPHGLRTLLGSGAWRFNPPTMDLEVFSTGLVNPWGNVWDRWGNMFQTDGAGSSGVNYSFPGAAFFSAVGTDRILAELNPGSPKYCGAEILSGRHVPDAYQGDLLTNDFRANRMVRFKLSDAGAGFASKQMPDFITSTDSAFRPVDIKMGPDGAIYIADWYNPIINHGEVDFRDPRRDHSHGRIWRVTAKGRPLVERPVIAGATVEDVLNLLKAPENYTRQQAKMELRERGAKAVLPALDQWVKSTRASDVDHEHRLLEALWVYQALDTPQPALLKRLLHADDPNARAAAVRVASRWAGQLDNISSILADAVADENPRVRLEAVRALALVPAPQSMTLAARVLDRPMDPFLDYALWRTANDLKDIWLPAFEAGKLTSWSKPAHLTFALEAVKSPAAVSLLLAQLKSNQLPPAARGDAIDLIAGIDPRGQAGTLFDLALGSDITDAPTRVSLLTALGRIEKQSHVRPSNDLSRIKMLIADSDPRIQSAALRLAGTWGLEDLRPEMTQLAEAPNTPGPVRDAAFDGISELGGPRSMTLLKKLSEPDNRPDVRASAIGALVPLDLAEAARRGADFLATGANGLNPDHLLGAFINREGGADALAGALAEKKLPKDTARLALRYLQSLASSDSPLSDVVRQSIGLTLGPTRLTPAQMKQTVAEVLEKGDAARGEQIFRSKQAGCFQCHSIGGSGGWLAPDLRSIGASSPVDYLVDSVLDPNKAVKDGYAGFIVVTRFGEVYTGIKVRQEAHTLILRDNTNPEIPIPMSAIKQQKQVGSLMPTGLADTLTHAEFLDLIRFLSDLGKPGPYGPSTAEYVRTWRISQSVAASTEINDFKKLPPSIAADGPNWIPAYSMVSGVLPLDDLAVGSSGPRVGFSRCQIDVEAAGKIELRLNSPAGLSAWIDGKPVEATSQMNAALDRGIHTVIFRVDVAARGGEGLRVEVADEPGSSGARSLSEENNPQSWQIITPAGEPVTENSFKLDGLAADNECGSVAMPVQLICPNLRCRKFLSVPDDVRGKLVKCQHCQTMFRVPDAARKSEPAPVAAGKPSN